MNRRKLDDERWMKRALELAARGVGCTSPNPCVGAVLLRGGRVIGEGWHRRAGAPHAEVEAMRDASRRGHRVRGATLYVTLEPCCTHGKTPPCTEAIIGAGIGRVVVASVDPNPLHRGRGLRKLRKAGIEVDMSVMEEEACRLNEAFRHWIVHRTPWVVLKAAMSLDGRIATRAGESKWITGVRARSAGMRLRRESEAILVGVGTILADDPSLTLRGGAGVGRAALRRVILDPRGRTPLTARALSAGRGDRTLVVVTRAAPASVVRRLGGRATVLVAPGEGCRIDLRWLMGRLGEEGVTQLLVEGGGETVAAFLEAGLGDRAVFFYAPLVMGDGGARPAVGGEGAGRLRAPWVLTRLEGGRLGRDMVWTGLIRRVRRRVPGIVRNEKRKGID